jgi:hypothetical protein
MAHSLIVVLVPEAEPHVATLREKFDPAARRALGAHITLRHAVLPATGIDAAMIGVIATVAAATVPFDFAITRVARFPGTLYLGVDPAAPFADLGRQLVDGLSAGAARPEPDKVLVPHISVVRRGSGADLAGAEVREVERELVEALKRHGPIRCACREIVLLEDATGSWQQVRAFELSGCTDSPARAPS